MVPYHETFKALVKKKKNSKRKKNVMLCASVDAVPTGGKLY